MGVPAGVAGYESGMSRETPTPPAVPPAKERAEERAEESAQQDRVDRRAELLPEEASAGSEEPRAQAEAILAESDDRTDHPERTRQEYHQTPG